MTAFYILVALNAVDAVLTVLVLLEGGTEKNALMRYLMDRMGWVPALVVVKALMLAAIYYFLPDLRDLIWALVAAYAAICVWNARVLRRLRG